MEHGSIERELHIDASPEVVYAVVSRPEHISEWWCDDAVLDPTPGREGTLTWHDADTGRTDSVSITVIESDPPHLFSFRWVYDSGSAPAEGNSLLVTFRLSADGAGTRLQFSETGFRERGWETAVLEQAYAEHTTGWDMFLPRLAARATRLVGTS